MKRTGLVAGLLMLNGCASARTAPDHRLTVVIDPGHMPSAPGATAICKKTEVEYNDAMGAAVVAALQDKYRVLLTRGPGQEASSKDSSVAAQLKARTDLANRENAALFISIHHDSVPDKQLHRVSEFCQGKGGNQVLPEFKAKYRLGFDVFVSAEMEPARREASIAFGEIVGRKLIALGRPASNYHVYPDDDCRSCEAVKAEVGVWQQKLAVLRLTHMPAILVEVGVLVDRQDEALVSSDEFRRRFALTIRESVDEYFGRRAK